MYFHGWFSSPLLIKILKKTSLLYNNDKVLTVMMSSFYFIKKTTEKANREGIIFLIKHSFGSQRRHFVTSLIIWFFLKALFRVSKVDKDLIELTQYVRNVKIKMFLSNMVASGVSIPNKDKLITKSERWAMWHKLEVPGLNPRSFLFP